VCRATSRMMPLVQTRPTEKESPATQYNAHLNGRGKQGEFSRI
jgi:hypothetical protein